MSSFRKALTAMAGLLVLLLTTPSLFGQPTGSYWGPLNKSELYGGRGGNATQSRNIPAGTVVDPGSQVLYIVDTGVNLREEGREASGDSELDEAKWGDPLEVVRPDLYEPGIGGSTLAPGAISQTFLAITNTHPTQAITVHFRYFNDECVDLLDFLVLLTCNDPALAPGVPALACRWASTATFLTRIRETHTASAGPRSRPVASRRSRRPVPIQRTPASSLPV